jgi:hypothetical protein
MDGIDIPPPVANDLGPSTVRYVEGAIGIFPGYYGRLEIAETRATEIELQGNVYIKGLVRDAFRHLGSKNVIGYTGETTGGLRYAMNFMRECSDAHYATCAEFVGYIYRREDINFTSTNFVGHH